MAWVCEALQECSTAAKPFGVRLALEPINRYETTLVNSVAQGMALIDQVGADNFGLLLDTFHMNIEEDSIGGAIRKAGQHLGHFHTGECNRRVPGRGRTHWREIGEALRDIHYQGAIVMEPFVRMGGQVGSDIKIWREMNPGADDAQLDLDAKNAVEFQRYMLD